VDGKGAIVSDSQGVIAFGSDHAGFELKTLLAEEVRALGYEVLDLGTHSTVSVDYPDFGAAVAHAVREERAWRGIIVCGSGIGISIAANRVPGARAALCSHGQMARLARQHNDANILALGARLIGIDVARECLREFLDTPFEGGRHGGRVLKLA
jgi:ribose 5-phosphate isomerase B